MPAGPQVKVIALYSGMPMTRLRANAHPRDAAASGKMPDDLRVLIAASDLPLNPQVYEYTTSTEARMGRSNGQGVVLVSRRCMLPRSCPRENLLGQARAIDRVAEDLGFRSAETFGHMV